MSWNACLPFCWSNIKGSSQNGYILIWLSKALIWWAFLVHNWPIRLRSRAKATNGSHAQFGGLWGCLWPNQSASAWCRPEPRAGPTVSSFSFLGKREQAALVSIEGDTVQVHPGHVLKSLGCFCIWKIRKIAQWQTTNEEKDNHLT